MNRQVDFHSILLLFSPFVLKLREGVFAGIDGKI